MYSVSAFCGDYKSRNWVKTSRDSLTMLTCVKVARKHICELSWDSINLQKTSKFTKMSWNFALRIHLYIYIKNTNFGNNFGWRLAISIGKHCLVWRQMCCSFVWAEHVDFIVRVELTCTIRWLVDGVWSLSTTRGLLQLHENLSPPH